MIHYDPPHFWGTLGYLILTQVQLTRDEHVSTLVLLKLCLLNLSFSSFISADLSGRNVCNLSFAVLPHSQCCIRLPVVGLLNHLLEQESEDASSRRSISAAFPVPSHHFDQQLSNPQNQVRFAWPRKGQVLPSILRHQSFSASIVQSPSFKLPVLKTGIMSSTLTWSKLVASVELVDSHQSLNCHGLLSVPADTTAFAAFASPYTTCCLGHRRLQVHSCHGSHGHLGVALVAGQGRSRSVSTA